MSVIKINAITVPADSGDELAKRFAARAGAVDDQDGFEGFELLQPADERTTWLVVTRWRDEAAFQAWMSSPVFGAGHRGSADGAARKAPVGVSSELWSYTVAGGSTPPTATTLTSHAEVAIERPQRWAKQLVSHLSRNQPAESTPEGDVLTFGAGRGTVRVADDRIILRAEGPDEQTLAQVEDVLGRHLVRFASDHDVAITWVR